MTSSQEIFVQNIVQGKSQRNAYNMAYPSSINWKKTTLDTRASQLMKNENVKARIEELRNIEYKKIKWNREIATKELLDILEMNKKELERIINTYEEEINLKETKLEEMRKEYKKFHKTETKKEINKLFNEITKIKKQPTITKLNIRAILEIINLLNKMYGIDKSKNELTQIDEERKNINLLTIDELKNIAYINNNNNLS